MKWTLRTLIMATILLGIALLTLSLTGYKVNDKDHLPLKKIKISGTYFYEGEEPKELSDNTIIDEDNREKVYITGNFIEPVPINYLVMLRVDNIKADIFLNGCFTLV